MYLDEFPRTLAIFALCMWFLRTPKAADFSKSSGFSQPSLPNMATCISNTYEAARNQQVELNKKKFEVFPYQSFISSLSCPRFLIFFWCVHASTSNHDWKYSSQFFIFYFIYYFYFFLKDMGILKISKSLAELPSPEKKSQVNLVFFFSSFSHMQLNLVHLSLALSHCMVQQRPPKPKLKTTCLSEPRRSTRSRNPVPSYRDDVSNDVFNSLVINSHIKE
jgi:hypothetical protein